MPRGKSGKGSWRAVPDWEGRQTRRAQQCILSIPTLAIPAQVGTNTVVNSSFWPARGTCGLNSGVGVIAETASGLQSRRATPPRGPQAGPMALHNVFGGNSYDDMYMKRKGLWRVGRISLLQGESATASHPRSSRTMPMMIMKAEFVTAPIDIPCVCRRGISWIRGRGSPARHPNRTNHLTALH